MWVEVHYAHVPNLEQYGSPGDEWWAMRRKIEQELGEPLPGGSFAFAKDEQGRLWFIEWDPFGDDCLYLCRGDDE